MNLARRSTFSTQAPIPYSFILSLCVYIPRSVHPHPRVTVRPGFVFMATSNRASSRENKPPPSIIVCVCCKNQSFSVCCASETIEAAAFIIIRSTVFAHVKCQGHSNIITSCRCCYEIYPPISHQTISVYKLTRVYRNYTIKQQRFYTIYKVKCLIAAYTHTPYRSSFGVAHMPKRGF